MDARLPLQNERDGKRNRERNRKRETSSAEEARNRIECSEVEQRDSRRKVMTPAKQIPPEKTANAISTNSSTHQNYRKRSINDRRQC